MRTLCVFAASVLFTLSACSSNSGNTGSGGASSAQGSGGGATSGANSSGGPATSSGGAGGATGSGATTSSATGSSTSSGGPDGKLFVGYYETWSDKWAATGAETVLAKMPGYVNVVNLSFALPGMTYTAGSFNLAGSGVMVPYDGPTLKDAVTALHQAHPTTKVMISVGGASYGDWASFAPKTIAAFVKDFGLDGVDIDYEPYGPACAASGGKVTCPSDAEYVGIVKNMRAALPAPYWLSVAAFSVGAYGEDQWVNAQPASQSTGIALAMLAQAGSSIDLVNIMAYDASPAYDPVEALHAYQHYYSGRVTVGIEVPPEAWGGHVATIAEIDSIADAVNTNNGSGLMLWSLQKQGPAQQFATEICTKLTLGSCATPLQ